MLEESADGEYTKRYVWSPLYVNALLVYDSLVSVGPTGRFWALHDANWNTIALVNSSGSIVERYDYTPFGKVTIYDGSGTVLSSSYYGMVYLFQGGRTDWITGDVSFGLRIYDPVLQRWTTVDPIELLAGDPNMQRFVGNGPGDGLDPSGLNSTGESALRSSNASPLPSNNIGSDIPDSKYTPAEPGRATVSDVPSAFPIGEFGTVIDNPEIPREWSGQYYTVIIVTGNPDERERWAAAARAKYGKDAYIFNDVFSAEQLGEVLARFPAGTVGRFIIGGHGSGCGVSTRSKGNQCPNTEPISLDQLKAKKNSKSTTRIRNALSVDAVVEIQSCFSGSSSNAVQQMADLLQARVIAATGYVGSWGSSSTAHPNSWYYRDVEFFDQNLFEARQHEAFEPAPKLPVPVIPDVKLPQIP